MRVLVVGAGAIGGYFGGRMLQAGRDVTFLVRPRRAAELASAGLVIKSPNGDVTLNNPPTVQADKLSDKFDVVLLSCKAFDLEDAIKSFAPAVGDKTAIVPLLNGMLHLDALDKTFGAQHVLGGLCAIAATLNEKREVVQLQPMQSLAFGERAGGLSDRVRLHGPVPFETRLVPLSRQTADVFVSCHVQSDPSCTYLEAMGCGLPVVGFANRMLAALVAAAVAMLAWPVNDWLNRRRARTLRAERVSDVQRALLAEIRAHVVALESQRLDAGGTAALLARLRDSGRIPFIPEQANDRIFSAIIEDVHILPAEVIDPVVTYYRQLSIMASFARAMQKQADQDHGRAVEMFGDYLELTEAARESGQEALRLLMTSVFLGEDALRRVIEEEREAELAARQAELALLSSSLPGELAALRQRLSRRSSDRSGL